MRWHDDPHGGPGSWAGSGVGLITVYKSAETDPAYRGGWYADAVYPAGRIGPYTSRVAAQRAALSASRRALRNALRSLTK
jgi:hypothetical protein